MATVERRSGWRREAGRAGALILHYHRVAHARSDLNRLCITPEYFAEHLAFLRSNAELVPLLELPGAVASWTPGSGRPVAITIDDGYADNLYSAKPLLEAYGAPATVFVVTGYLGSAAGLWWDELERLVTESRLPEDLAISVGGRHRRVMTRIPWWAAIARLLRPGRSVRGYLYRRLHRLLIGLSHAERNQALAQIRDQLDAVQQTDDCRVLTRQELIELARSEVIDIGAHTVTHPLLAALPVKEQLWEIQEAKAELERILCAPVSAFAYPFGSRGSYTEETVSIVRRAGFAVGCTTLISQILPGADHHQLPRLSVGNWSGSELARQLQRAGW